MCMAYQDGLVQDWNNGSQSAVESLQSYNVMAIFAETIIPKHYFIFEASSLENIVKVHSH